MQVTLDQQLARRGVAQDAADNVQSALLRLVAHIERPAKLADDARRTLPHAPCQRRQLLLNVALCSGMSLQLRRARLVRRRRRGHLEVLVLRAPPAVRATTASVGGRRRLCVLVRRVGASSRASTAGGGGRVRSTTSREARRRQLFAIATIRRQTSTPVGLHERRGQATGKGRASRASWSHYRGRDR